MFSNRWGEPRSGPAPADPFKANCGVNFMSPEWRHPETNGAAGPTIIRMHPGHATRGNASIGATA
jgi:hypothetical protein